jgi:hypothetical protein
MKTAILVATLAGVSFGQAGTFWLSSDPAGLDCLLDDSQEALRFVYVTHANSPGATASQFRIHSGGGFNCTYLSYQSNYLTLGEPLSGIAIAYGICISSPITILELIYYCTGTSETCSWLTVCPDLNAPTGTIEVVDCSFNKLVGFGGVLWVNTDGYSCGCWVDSSEASTTAVNCDAPVPVRDSTWGSIKSLYR